MVKLYFVKVFTTDVELELTVPASTKGFQLFQQVCETIGIREVWYFGMNYINKHNELVWLDLNKKILKQIGGQKGTIYLNFSIKHFPEDVQNELIFETTQRLFYLNVRESILEGKIDCSFETAVLLASYACQVKYGDYDEGKMQAGFLSKEKMIPQRVLEKEQYSILDVENMIVQWYQQHREMFVSDVMLEYLRIAQDLEMFGVTYFAIKNKRGTDLLLGVNAAGLNVYSTDDRLKPKLSFPWSEIANVNFHKRKFVISPVDKKSNSLILYSSHTRYNQRLFSICIGTHELYTRRRRPEPIEVQHMRAQAEAERNHRLKERARLSKALQANHEAAKQIEQLTATIAMAEAEKGRADHYARELARRVEELELQLHEEARLRAQLEAAEKRLIEYNADLKEICEKGEDERRRLLEEKEIIENQIVSLQRSVFRSSVKVDQHRAAIAKMSNLSLASAPVGALPTVTDFRERGRKRMPVTTNTTFCYNPTSMDVEQRHTSRSHPTSPSCPSNPESHITSLTLNIPQISKTNSMSTDSDIKHCRPPTPDLSVEGIHPSRHECLEHLSDAEYKENAPNPLDEEEHQNGSHNKSCRYDTRWTDYSPAGTNDHQRYTIYSEFNLEMPNRVTSDGQCSRQDSAAHSQNDSYCESFNNIRQGNTKKQVDVFESM